MRRDPMDELYVWLVIGQSLILVGITLALIKFMVRVFPAF